MRPLLDPIALVIAFILTLFVTIAMFFPSLLVLIPVAGSGQFFPANSRSRRVLTAGQ